MSEAMTDSTKTRISIIVPCFDEEPTIPMLQPVLANLLSSFGDAYDVEILFVDDGSSDATLGKLREVAPDLHGRVLVHPHNKGIAEAFRTGFRAALGDIICTIDADCTFDPMELVPMVAQLEESGVEIVSASPYHPEGGVEGVPAWRLVLSGGASFLYRWILPVKLYSYTACFRVFRRSALEKIHFDDSGFLGVAQILISALLQGVTVLERPMTLKTRVSGVSKMRTLTVIRDHAGFMWSLLWGGKSRLTDPDPSTSALG
jgi:dolichol-phosphate mannosyltransferase